MTAKERTARDKSITDAFRQQVVAELEKAYGKFEDLTSEKVGIVQALYIRYFERFTNDNNRIWATGNIFIPLSLAGLISLKDSTVLFTSLLALGSIALMAFWVLVAENHRAFQQRSQTTVEAIEAYLKFTVAGGKLTPHPILEFEIREQKVFTVQKIRWLMLWAVSIIWLAAVACKWIG